MTTPTLPAPRSLALARDYGVVLSAVGLFIALAIASAPFRTGTNQLNLLDQWSTIGIIACGSTICIVAGGFDLSVDAIFALSGVLAAWLAVHLGDPTLALLVGMLSGLVLGVFNGLLVTVGRINPFVATIASSVVFLGIAQLITRGSVLSVAGQGFSRLGLQRFGDLTLPAVVFVVFAVLTAVLLARTVVGRRLYAVGGNYEAARYSGIAVNRVQVFAYAVSGLSASIAGVLAASRNSSASADIRTDLAFQAITAVVIGGVSIYGGAGTIPRALVGVLILALIGNGFNLLAVDPAYQQVLLGIIIVLAVAVDAWARRTQK
ncbi:ABC transporter permease [Nocardioides kongjuensis]|uniref:Ribose transport system permease protein n=1 Tax=Nocardioides kongjuensis TaxID=349522 RepID=A0A852RY08_9ACTN|nr:ABC transporter permease [Nocardioides kongjuensis]NYD32734.1 ribose transport system permease protein [Nocardioides kongjuensis]